MESNWKGRYAKLIAALVKHSNCVYTNTNRRTDRGGGEYLTLQEFQLLEYLVEHSEDNSNMMTISAALGIPQSSLSKNAKVLLENQLAEKYMLVGNRKNIILKATPKGEKIFAAHCENFSVKLFGPFFEKLDSVSDKDIGRFMEAINELNKGITADEKEVLVKVD